MSNRSASASHVRSVTAAWRNNWSAKPMRIASNGSQSSPGPWATSITSAAVRPASAARLASAAQMLALWVSHAVRRMRMARWRGDSVDSLAM